MTTSFPATKTGVRLGFASAALTGALAMALLAGLPARAEDANPVLAKVNGSEIRQSDVALAEEDSVCSTSMAREASSSEVPLMATIRSPARNPSWLKALVPRVPPGNIR